MIDNILPRSYLQVTILLGTVHNHCTGLPNCLTKGHPVPEELVDGEGTPDPKGVRLDIPLAIYYYPQTKFAKVMFSHVSVCP